MSLSDILKKIESENQIQVDKIQEEFVKQKKELDKSFEEKEKEEVVLLEKKTQAALESVDRKIDSMARRKNSQLFLKTKRDILDQAMGELLTLLENADEAVYEGIITTLIKELPFTEGTLRVPSKRALLMKSKAADFNIVSDENIKGGFVAQNKGIEVDNTFTSLIFSEYRSGLETYFADQLKLV